MNILDSNISIGINISMSQLKISMSILKWVVSVNLINAWIWVWVYVVRGCSVLQFRKFHFFLLQELQLKLVWPMTQWWLHYSDFILIWRSKSAIYSELYEMCCAVITKYMLRFSDIEHFKSDMNMTMLKNHAFYK